MLDEAIKKMVRGFVEEEIPNIVKTVKSDLSPPMTVSEAAKEIKIDPVTLRKWIDEGKLPYVNLSNKRGKRVFIDELNRCVKENLRGKPKKIVKKIVEAER